MLGLRTVVYFVADLQKAKEWYAKAFETEAYFDEPFYVGFNIAGYELGLLPIEESVIKKGDNTICYWGVEKIEEVYERLIALGGTEHENLHSVGGQLTVASVRDPWGNIIGIIYNPASALYLFYFSCFATEKYSQNK